MTGETKPDDPELYRLSEPAQPAEVAEYLADILQELRDLAAGGGQHTVSLLLDLARKEAQRDIQRARSVNQGPPPTLPMAG